ncbi:hypothetical protein [Ureaplasma ceti]|uniref:Uncharacterized protein n=1 Tax=Ureaplasma ceti TaxID=3119530 RepID=A0ABP9U7L4_9BACT
MKQNKQKFIKTLLLGLGIFGAVGTASLTIPAILANQTHKTSSNNNKLINSQITHKLNGNPTQVRLQYANICDRNLGYPRSFAGPNNFNTVENKRAVIFEGSNQYFEYINFFVNKILNPGMLNRANHRIKWWFKSSDNNNPQTFTGYEGDRGKELKRFVSYVPSTDYTVSNAKVSDSGLYGISSLATSDLNKEDYLREQVSEHPFRLIVCPKVATGIIKVNGVVHLSYDLVYGTTAKIDVDAIYNHNEHKEWYEPLMTKDYQWEYQLDGNDQWKTLSTWNKTSKVPNIPFEYSQYNLRCLIRYKLTDQDNLAYSSENCFICPSNVVKINVKKSLSDLKTSLTFDYQKLVLNNTVIVNEKKNGYLQDLTYTWSKYNLSTKRWERVKALTEFTNNEGKINLIDVNPGKYKFTISFKGEQEGIDSCIIQILPTQTLIPEYTAKAKIALPKLESKLDLSNLPTYSIYKENGQCIASHLTLQPDGNYQPLYLDTSSLKNINNNLYVKTYNPRTNIHSVQLVRLQGNATIPSRTRIQQSDSHSYIHSHGDKTKYSHSKTTAKDSKLSTTEMNPDIITSDSSSATAKTISSISETEKSPSSKPMVEQSDSVKQSKTFEWWKILLIMLSALTGVGCGVWIIKFISKKRRQKYKKVED